MHFLASGLSNKEIARKLDLSPETIKTHLREIFTRMNVKNRTQAVSPLSQNSATQCLSLGIETKKPATSRLLI
jgi:DNA-binding NarL/FixJ family response regulator